MNTIYEDFSLVRPTQVTSTPRFWNKLYEEYKEALSAELSQGLSFDEADKKALMQLQHILGDRLKL